MKIALYGATGSIGKTLLTETLGRGHTVTAIVRDPARLDVTNNNLTVVTGDITDPASVAQSVAGHDAVIASISGRRNGTASFFSDAARSLIAGLRQSDVKRVLWVGGAGSLEVAPGVRLIDTPGFPEAYKTEALAQVGTLAEFRTNADGLEWGYLSPAAVIAPGTRTGVFRLGGDQLLTDAEGQSRISIEDFAVGLLNEVENPQHIRQRFTIAY